jgi:MFS family permease
MLNRAQSIYKEFPGHFWVLSGATFIDRLGGALIFPFFSLYMTEKFGVGLTEVGYLFLIFSVGSFFGSMLGGALTDKFGRKAVLLFGLVISGLSSLAMGLINELVWFYSLAALVGLLADVAGPAQQAMVADLLPQEKRNEGFGIIRVIANLAFSIGPAIGGMMAARSYLLLFVADAVSSLITAAIAYILLPETKPAQNEDAPEESISRSIIGYGVVLKDRIFMAFLFFVILATMVYFQLNSTLAVYLRDVHDIPPQGFGYLLSTNAFIIVVFQFWVSRRIANKPPLIIMAVGTAMYAIGFVLFGFVSHYALFLVAIIIITIGEMVQMPTSQALVATLAPEHMRGRYMAVFGLAWLVPAGTAPLAAGIVMDNYNPNWVWYAAGIIGILAMLGFLVLQNLAGKRVKDLREELDRGNTAEPA